MKPHRPPALLRLALVISAALGLDPACSPEPTPDNLWALGTYSDQPAGYLGTNSYVTRYEIRADGTFVVRGFTSCGDVVIPPQEHVWRHVGEGAVEVEFLEGEQAGSSWHITPGADCNEIRIQPYFATQPEIDYTLGRGEVCLRPEICDPENECFCETHWCDAPPPACEPE